MPECHQCGAWIESGRARRRNRPTGFLPGFFGGFFAVSAFWRVDLCERCARRHDSAVSGIGLAAVVALVLVFLLFLFGYLVAHERAQSAWAPTSPPPSLPAAR